MPLAWTAGGRRHSPLKSPALRKWSPALRPFREIWMLSQWHPSKFQSWTETIFAADQKLSVAQADFCFKGAKKPCLSSLALKGVAPPEKGKKCQQQWEMMSQFPLQMTDHTDRLGTALLQLCYIAEPNSSELGESEHKTTPSNNLPCQLPPAPGLFQDITVGREEK